MKKKKEVYSNLNIQDLYDRFNKEYKNTRYKKSKGKLVDVVFKDWLSSYIKSTYALQLLILALSIIVCVIIYKDNILYKYMALFMIPVLILSAFVHYSETHGDEEKLLAEKAIISVLEEENLAYSQSNVSVIYNYYEDVKAKDISLFKKVINTFIKMFKNIFLYILGLATAYLNTKVVEIKSISSLDVKELFPTLFQILLIIFTLYFFCYFYYKLEVKNVALFKQVLKDKLLTCNLNDKINNN